MKLQEKRQKSIAADFAHTMVTKRKALGVLLAYAEFRRIRAQQTLAARHHCRQHTKAAVLGAWRAAAGYLAPIRRALHTIATKVGVQGRLTAGQWHIPVDVSVYIGHGALPKQYV